MTMYRVNASAELEIASPKPRRFRALAIAVVSIGAHAAIIGAAFAARGRGPVAPRTAVVQVLAGHVDPWTGDFQAIGLRSARIRD